MIWKKFKYQKECWRLWHWLSFAQNEYSIYSKSSRDFSTKDEAKKYYFLEKLEK
jgi:hypothetical protein